MIFWELFYTFCKIGIFNFGGGYAMIALIQSEVVENHAWMTAQEFTDIVAVSQMTPGPLGINVATYAGYTSVINAGYGAGWAVLGSFLASFAVLLLPFLLLLAVSRFLRQHRDNKDIANILSTLRIAIVGVVAAAALLLISPETFGSFAEDPIQVICSIALFGAVFIASYVYRTSPILLILLCGLAGFLLYGI
ncbi:MAG: chromate transporter [Bacteroidales bacterium]|nr:chromate transporter [Bacteroidales bacterium]